MVLRGPALPGAFAWGVGGVGAYLPVPIPHSHFPIAVPYRHRYPTKAQLEQFQLEEQTNSVTEEEATYDLGTAPPVADDEYQSNEAEGEPPPLPSRSW